MINSNQTTLLTSPRYYFPTFLPYEFSLNNTQILETDSHNFAVSNCYQEASSLDLPNPSDLLLPQTLAEQAVNYGGETLTQPVPYPK